MPNPKKLASKTFKAITARILIETKDGQFLLLKRAPYKTHGGKWDLAGGGVEFGETPQEAAINEIKEEAGLKIKKLKPVATLETDGRLRILFHAVVKKPSEPKLNREHTKYKWVDSLDNHGKAMHPNTEKLIKMYLKTPT